MAASYRPGDFVVYRTQKQSTHPGPRAQAVQAAAKGDSYSYLVEKCWIVRRVLEDGTLQLETRRGKTHTVNADDPKLRRANIWDRLRYWSRFAALKSKTDSSPTA